MGRVLASLHLLGGWQQLCEPQHFVSGRALPWHRHPSCVACDSERPSFPASEPATAGWLRLGRGRRHTSRGASGKGGPSWQPRCSRQHGRSAPPARRLPSVGHTPRSIGRGRPDPPPDALRLNSGSAPLKVGQGPCRYLDSSNIILQAGPARAGCLNYAPSRFNQQSLPGATHVVAEPLCQLVHRRAASAEFGPARAGVSEACGRPVWNGASRLASAPG